MAVVVVVVVVVTVDLSHIMYADVIYYLDMNVIINMKARKKQELSNCTVI